MNRKITRKVKLRIIFGVPLIAICWYYKKFSLIPLGVVIIYLLVHLIYKKK